MSDDDICIARETNLLSTTAVFAGYECDSGWIYAGLLLVTFLLQLWRNNIWAHSGQAQREIAHYGRHTKERCHFLWVLMWNTFLSTLLSVINIVLLVSSNLGVLLTVVVGTLVGTYIAYSRIAADNHSTCGEISDWAVKYRHILVKPKKSTEELNMLKNMRRGQRDMQMLVLGTNAQEILQRLQMMAHEKRPSEATVQVAQPVAPSAPPKVPAPTPRVPTLPNHALGYMKFF